MTNKVPLVRIGDLCETVSGLWTGKKPPFEQAIVIRNTNFTKDCKLDLTNVAILDVESRQLRTRKLLPGDLIVEKSGGGPKQAVGRVVLFNEVSGIFSLSNFTSALRIKAFSTALPDFLNYFLLYQYVSGVTETMQSNSTGIRNLNIHQFLDIKIPLPAHAAQVSTVKKLDKIFVEIASLEENLRRGEELVSQLMLSILNEHYSKAGITFEPLGDLVDVLDNQRIPINASERLNRPGEVPYYGATGQVGTIDKAIFNETLILLGEDGVPFLDPKKHKAYEITGESWVNNHAHVLRARQEKVVQRFLLHYLNVFNYSGYVNGATRLKLTQGDMRRIPVPVPPLPLQQEIVKKVDSAISQLDQFRIQLEIQSKAILSLRLSVLHEVFANKEVDAI